jgi:NAD(P)-dependent dehydrogenase (short-subunit alcohol dehydrogenase family)
MHEMKCYEGKVAVITGAGSGIGRALAQQLAGHGARLALSDVSEAGLAGTVASCGAKADVRAYRLDVSKRDAVFAHADEVKRDFGTAHFVFNNAGVSIAATVEHITIEELEWLLGINLWGVIYGTKAFLPMMLAQRAGHIVNLSSVFGMVAVPTQSAYHMSKFAVRGLTECLWRELEGTGVVATSVHPGGIKTSIKSAAPVGKFAGDVEKAFMVNLEKLLVTTADECARDILQGVARGERRILTGKSSSIVDLVSRLMPKNYGLVLKRFGL